MLRHNLTAACWPPLRTIDWRYLAILLIVSLLYAWPLFKLLADVAAVGPRLAELTRFNGSRISLALGNSLALALLTSLLGTLLAAALAYLSERREVPLRRCIAPAMMAVFATPAVFYALGFSALASPYGGLLNTVLGGKGAHAPVNIESYGGILLVATLRHVAFAYLCLRGPMRALAGSHEEASRLFGASTWATLRHVQLPALLPALSSVALLGLIAGLQTFELVLVLGTPADIEVIGTLIFTSLTAVSPPDHSLASLLSGALLLLIGSLLWLQARLLGNRGFVAIGGKAAAAQQRQRFSRPWSLLLAILLGGYLLLALLLPLLCLLLVSLQAHGGGALGLMHYQAVLGRSSSVLAIGNTVLLAVSVSSATLLICVAASRALERLQRLPATLLRSLLLIPMGMPGIVLALAISSAYVEVPLLRSLHGSLGLMTLALCVALTPLLLQLTQAAFGQVGHELHEAAQISGARRWRATRDIDLPLVAQSLWGIWFLAAVMVAGSLDIPLLLGGPGLTTIATEVYQLNAQSRNGEAAALLILLLGLLAALWLAVHLLQRSFSITPRLSERRP